MATDLEYPSKMGDAASARNACAIFHAISHVQSSFQVLAAVIGSFALLQHFIASFQLFQAPSDGDRLGLSASDCPAAATLTPGQVSQTSDFTESQPGPGARGCSDSREWLASAGRGKIPFLAFRNAAFRWGFSAFPRRCFGLHR